MPQTCAPRSPFAIPVIGMLLGLLSAPAGGAPNQAPPRVDTITRSATDRASMPSAHDVLDQARRFYTGLKSMRVDVEISLQDSAGKRIIDGSIEQSEGQFRVLREWPWKMVLTRRVRGRELFTIRSDGKHIYVYDPKRREYAVALISDLEPGVLHSYPARWNSIWGKTQAGMFIGGDWDIANALCDFLDVPPRALKSVTLAGASSVDIETLEGQQCYRLRLLGPAKVFLYHTWIGAGDPPFVRRMAMTVAPQSLGSPPAPYDVSVVYEFRNWEVNVDFPPGTFEFQPPSNAKLVEKFSTHSRQGTDPKDREQKSE